MIERKGSIFRAGLELFLFQYCGSNRDAYIEGMVHGDGYRHEAEQFYKYSGYLTMEDARNLRDYQIIPPWMVEVILSFERDVFGASMYDKR